jgi:hypothetical protein
MTPTRRRTAWAAVLIALAAVPVAGWLALRAVDSPPVEPRLLAGPPTGKKVLSRLVLTGRALGAVRPGMARAEVEEVLGRPAPDAVGPVVGDGGRAVYVIRYPAELDGPVWCAPDLRGPCEAVLEYDAARPGHPLLGATCTPVATLPRAKAA